jgi:hypothetical protein
MDAVSCGVCITDALILSLLLEYVTVTTVVGRIVTVSISF